MAQIAGALEASQSAGPRRVYASDWRRFRSWCHAHGHPALPAHPATVAAYLVDAADTLTEVGEKAYSPSTLNRWVSVIGHYHRTANLRNPCTEALVASTLSGIRRTYAANGDRARSPRAPLLVEDVVTIVGFARRAVTGWAAEVHERRDSALLLMGFAGAFRRSDLVALTCGDVTVHRLDGVHVRLRRSKTDQEGTGTVRASPFTTNQHSCPPCAYVRWAQVVAAFDLAGRPGVIRLLRTAPLFDSHVCRSALPRMRARAPLFRAIAKNGNLSDTGCRGLRCMRRSGAAPRPPATTRTSLPSSVGTRCGPGLSPRRSATAPTRTRSCARPGIPPRRWWSSTPANTHRSSATPSPTSASERVRRHRHHRNRTG